MTILEEFSHIYVEYNLIWWHDSFILQCFGMLLDIQISLSKVTGMSSILYTEGNQNLFVKLVFLKHKLNL